MTSPAFTLLVLVLLVAPAAVDLAPEPGSLCETGSPDGQARCSPGVCGSCPPPSQCLPSWPHHHCLILPDPSRPYNRNSFLVTHNSFALLSTWMPWAANQARPLWRQLQDGVRGFMLDLWPFNDSVALCHASCDSVLTHIRVGEKPDSLDSALKIFKEFLESYPDEVLTIFYETYVKWEEVIKAYQRTGVWKYIFHRGRWPDPGEDWPALKDMAPAIVAFDQTDFDYIQETMYGTLRTNECADRPESARHLDEKRALLLVNYFPPANPGLPNRLVDLIDKLSTCKQNLGKWANFLAVDYYEKNLPDAATILAVSWLNSRW